MAEPTSRDAVALPGRRLRPESFAAVLGALVVTARAGSATAATLGACVASSLRDLVMDAGGLSAQFWRRAGAGHAALLR